MTTSRQSLTVVAALFIAGLTSAVVGQSGQPADRFERPKEAAVESISDDIDPSMRTAIADKLRVQIDQARQKLTAERSSLKALQDKLREQEKQVRQLDLKVQYLQDRLEQWSPASEEDEAEAAE